jgi:predicted nucleic acid-binding protein
LKEDRFRVLPVTATEFSLARDWIGRFSTPLRTADALHLAAAFANELAIITADKGLADSAKLLGVQYELVSYFETRRK